jgi:hypothetical protein
MELTNEQKVAVASYMKDEGKRQALAEFLVEYVDVNHLPTSLISLLLDTRSLKYGDQLVKKVRKGIRVHTLVPGATHMKSEITVSERMNYVLDGAIVGVQANEWDLKSGELGSVESIRGELEAKLRDYYLGKVFTMLTSVWTLTNTPSNYISAGGSLTAADLVTGINTINQTVAGGAKAIVGTRAALQPITTFGAFWSDGTSNYDVPSQLEEVMKTGWLGKFYGVPVVVLDQVYDNPEDYNKLLPEDKVLIIGEKVGEFITFGEVQSKEWTDMRPTPPYWNLELLIF